MSPPRVCEECGGEPVVYVYADGAGALCEPCLRRNAIFAQRSWDKLCEFTGYPNDTIPRIEDDGSERGSERTQ